MKAYKIDVFGKVHGVYYRADTCRKAGELNINGTVKNMPDGSVQIIAEGEEDKLEEFIQWCNNGPLLAKVSSVNVLDINFYGYSGFEIIR